MRTDAVIAAIMRIIALAGSGTVIGTSGPVEELDAASCEIPDVRIGAASPLSKFALDCATIDSTPPTARAIDIASSTTNARRINTC
jgi:hypothetical protein